MPDNEKRHGFRINAGVVLLVLALIAATAAFFWEQGTVSASQEAAQTPQPFSGSAEEQEIEYLTELLQNLELDPGLRISLEEKLAMAQNILDQRIAAEQNRIAAAQAVIPTPAPAEPKPFPPGIFAGGEGLFHPSQAVIMNYWQSQVDGEYIQVFAGRDGADPAQGFLAVVTTSSDFMQTEFEIVEPPDASGAVQVLQEDDLVLILEGENQARYCFDLPSRSFVCALR